MSKASESIEQQPPESDKDKFQQWYAKHGDSWNERRRSRYSDDPAYREKVLERNRQHRQEKRAEQKVQTAKETSARKGAVRRRWKSVTLDGVEYYTIGSLAERLGVSVQAVRLWERQGLIKPPVQRFTASERGPRIYTLEEIEQIRAQLKSQKRLPEPGARNAGGVRAYEREVVYAGGKVKSELLYTIGTLARTIPKTVVTLEHHERDGKLPATPLRGSSVRRRFYTLSMIEVVKEAFDRWGPAVRGDDWQKFHDHVAAGWKKLGVNGAKLKNPDQK